MADKGARLKMSNKKFRVLVIIPLAIIALVAVLLTAASVLMGGTLDTYLGKGETTTQAPAETQGWDATYYDIELTTEGDER